jgi:hypothetical protein
MSAGSSFGAEITQYPSYGRVDPAQEMALRNAPFQIEEVKQLALITPLPTHHDSSPSPKTDGITIRQSGFAGG